MAIFKPCSMFMSPLMLAEQLIHLAGPGHRPLCRVDAGGLQLGRRRGRGEEVRDGVHTADTRLADTMSLHS